MFLEHNPESVPDMNLIDSGGCLYSLNPDNDDVKHLVEGDDGFVQSFYLFCNQSNNKSIKDKIYTELKLILGADEGYSKTICENLCSSLREWVNTHNFYLKNNWKSWLSIFDSYVKKEVTTCNDMVTRIKYSSVETLKAHIEGCNPAWIRPPGEDAVALSATKIHQAVRGERHIMVSVTRLGELEEKVLRCWGPFCRWLVLVDDDERSYDTLLRMERRSGPKRRLVIVSYKGDAFFEDSFKSGDIRDDSWKELMDVSIKLNSEQHLCRLEDVCDIEALKAMLDGKPKALLALSQLSGPVRMGQSLDPLPVNHISRHLTYRMRVREEFFSSLGEKKVCIMDKVVYNSCTNISFLKNTVRFEEVENYLRASDPVWPLFVVTNSIDISAVQMICNEYADIHVYVLSHVDGGWLYVEEQSIKLLQVVDGFRNRVIIEGKPGVGKSTTLLEMARQLKEKHPAWWILRLDLLKYTEVFDSCDSGVEASKDILLRAVYNGNYLGVLEHTFLQHCLQEYPRIICLVDGFDEVCPDYAEKCLEALQELAPRRGQLVVTTRPSVTGRLEAALGVSAHSLPEFSDKQLDEFHRKPFSEIGVTNKVRDLLKIPLFSNMYADLLGSKTMVPVHDIVSLYEAFFERKFRRLYEEKNGSDLSKLVNKKMVERERCQHEKRLGFLAVSHFFPRFEVPGVWQFSSIERDDLMKAGLIYQFINDRPVFIHRTFAEYFLAKWCISNVSDGQRGNLYRKALSDRSAEFFVEFFDRMASRGRPLLTAVLNGSVREVQSLLEKGADPAEGDKFGRNTLHLVASYSRDSALLRLLMEHLEVVGATKVRRSASRPANVTRKVMEAEAVSRMNGVARFVEKGRTTESKCVASDSELAEAWRATGPWGLEQKAGAVDTSQVVEGMRAATAALGAEDGLLHWTPLRYAAERRRWSAVPALLEVGAQLHHLGDFQRGLYSPQVLWRIFKEDGYKALFDHIVDKNGLAWTSRMEQQRVENKRCLEIQVGVSIVCAEMSAEQYVEIRRGAFDSINTEVRKLIDLKMQDIHRKSKTVGSVVLELCHLNRGTSQMDEGTQMRHHVAGLGGSTFKQHTRNLLHSIFPDLTTADDGVMLCDAVGETLLNYAARRGDVECLRHLIEAGADVNMQDSRGQSAIHVAALTGNVECINCLHCAGADVNIKDNKGSTPLHNAAWMGRPSCVKLLLDAGADALLRDCLGDTPLHVAALAANAECVRLLAGAVENLELTNVNGVTAMHFAAKNGDLESLKQLLRSGAHSSPVSNTLSTPLHEAAQEGYAECVRLLLHAKADVTARDAEGNTALHCAILSGNTGCVKHLLKAGAHVHEKNGFGNTPLHCAAGGSPACVRLLVKKGADVNCKNSLGQTPLHFAAFMGRADNVTILLDASADALAEDSYSFIPLHMAVNRKNAECVRLLFFTVLGKILTSECE